LELNGCKNILDNEYLIDEEGDNTNNNKEGN
jgi:hypothetical protein